MEMVGIGGLSDLGLQVSAYLHLFRQCDYRRSQRNGNRDFFGELVGQALRKELLRSLINDHGIRGVSDYAEQIVAEALGGHRRTESNSKGFDVIAPNFGRIEVKFRQLPKDGRMEERVALSKAKEGEFDYLAIVIFDPEFEIKGAVMVPYFEAWQYVCNSPYNRISYSQACSCANAEDITEKVRLASDR